MLKECNKVYKYLMIIKTKFRVRINSKLFTNNLFLILLRACNKILTKGNYLGIGKCQKLLILKQLTTLRNRIKSRISYLFMRVKTNLKRRNRKIMLYKCERLDFNKICSTNMSLFQKYQLSRTL